MRYIKWIGIGLMTIPLFIIGLFITPINYLLRHPLRKYFPNVNWWFLNDTLPYDKNDIDWGDFGRFSHNFKGYYQQNALRNSHWNLKRTLLPHTTNITEVKGDMEELGIDWGKYKSGFRFATFTAEGVKYFRTSWTVEFLGSRYWHAQLGAFYRYKFKMKWGKIADKKN